LAAAADAMTPSVRATLLSNGYREAQGIALFGVFLAVLPAFVSLVALALAMRPSPEKPAPPRAIPMVAAVLLLISLGGGFAFWFRGAPKVEQHDEASWMVLDADYLLAHASADKPNVDDACKLMQGFTRITPEAPARKLPQFAGVAERCVDWYIERAQNAGKKQDATMKASAETAKPEQILAELEKSTLPITDKQKKAVETLKKDLDAAKRGTPKVSIEAVTVLGLIDVEAMKKLLEPELAKVGECYAAESKDAPFLAGLVVIVAKLEKGAPTTVEARNDANTLTGVPAQCAQKTVQTVRLENANGMATIIFRFDHT
jgi:hypothetical protein